MRRTGVVASIGCIFSMLLLCACATIHTSAVSPNAASKNEDYAIIAKQPDYAARLPQHRDTGGERMVLIDPDLHVWGAYDANGNLVRAGLVTAGADWCPDVGRRCHTKAGTFRVFSLGSYHCKSSIYPLPRGGAPMPYCMFFNRNQGMHGSPENALAEANLSHGCVRMHVYDAEWLRFNFVHVGTKVVVKSY
ncbi:MAG: hypothetical protein A3E83_09025 [Gammaproteobacteria bacterium RIFCSPHIGHO2_12_FULL_41_20]|nr:MAG: hypothetical protein A3E83_09025 [Gammaproteobacteria bacterium RIFCSPHIGHO2_12_FULL_41_20]